MTMNETPKPDIDHDIQTLTDEELDAVTGGSAISDAIKAVGEGLSTMARKQ